jgi:arginine/lysine/ornithine decarboxylase
MKKMPTRTAERVYDVLCRFADADPSYYEKETFIFHFGVLSTTSSSYKLNCINDAQRTFHCSAAGKMRVEGSTAGKVNGILWKMSEELMSKNVELNEISSTN